MGIETDIEYDSNVVELVSVVSSEDGIFPSDTFEGSESLTANPYYLSWDNSLSDAVIANGNLAILKFKIKSGAYNGEYAVTPLFSSGGAFDEDLNDVDFNVESGCITVTDGIIPDNPITTSTTTTKATTTTTKATTTTSSSTSTTTTTTTTTVPGPDLTVDLSMLTGASIRLNEQTGIRFYTTVDKDKINALKSEGYTVEMGTLIAPLDYLTNDTLTFDLAQGRYIDVKYTSEKYFTDSSGFSGIVGSIVNIKENTFSNQTSGNIVRKFAGRGYVKVIDKNGIETISYAPYEADNARSLGYVAYYLKNDSSADAQELYSNNRELVDKWSEHYQKLKDPMHEDIF